MILGFDIGNTHTVMGLYSRNDVTPHSTFRYRTIRDVTSDEAGASICGLLKASPDETIEGIAFSSVVPGVNGAYHALSRRFFSLTPVEVNSRCKLGISIKYDDPAQLGADRIANAEAAVHQYHRDSIIVDMGTATTFCVVHGTGAYDGGMIGPGIGITIEALAGRTSQLRQVAFEKPEKMIATHTSDSIKSGFYYGWLSMVEGIIKRIEDQYQQEFLHILTGGYCEIMGSAMKTAAMVDPMLTMKGIKLIFDRNSGRNY